MLLEELRKKIEILSEEESHIIRDLYIEYFVDTRKEEYKKYIANTELFSDGYCYTGYLWDYLVDYERIAINTLVEELLNKQEVLVLWDIHSCDRIFIENYWKFPKDRVIKIDAKILIEGLEHLPEDVYIFDYDFSWTYIITHEIDSKRRICFRII